MKIKRSFVFYVFVVAIVSAFNLTFAVDYPATISVPVTYYDFHSDRTNPEFEPRHLGQLRTGMVASTLGADGKPTLGSSPYLNYGIKYWFKSWEDGAKGDFSIPGYNPTAGYKQAWYVRDTVWNADSTPVLNPDGTVKMEEGDAKEYNQLVTYDKPKTVDYDTAFKNIVIHDSLRFVYKQGSDGVYEYKNAAFFPLDNKGFGNEWNRELGKPNPPGNVKHNYSFTMEMHYSFVKMPGMTFDFSGDDDVWVFTNKQLQLDLGGIHKEEFGSFRVDTITGLQNGTTYDLDVFYAERHSAESHISITTNMIFAPSNLRLYRYPGTPGVGANVSLGTSDTLPIGQPISFYGHVFDSNGVWHQEFDDQITWEIIDNNGNPGLNVNKGATVTVTATKPNSEIVLIAHFKDPGNPTKPESEVRITLYTRKAVPLIPYELRLYGKSEAPDVAGNLPIGGTTVTVTAGKSLSVFGHLFDSTKTWQPNLDQNIKWRILESGTGAVLLPVTGEQTSVTLSKAGSTVTLIASFSDPTNLSRPPSEARLTINVLPGAAPLPYELLFYRIAGAPDVSGNLPIGGTITIPAGEPLVVFGHLFDSTKVWQQNLDQYIKWRILESGTGVVPEPATGEQTSVTFSKSGVTVTLVASFSDPTNLARPPSEARLTINVLPGPPFRLEIIENSTPKNFTGDDKFIELVMGKGDQSKMVYAILRDRFGNYIRLAESAYWRSDAPVITQVSPTIGSFTNVTKSKNADGEESFITAVQDGLSDTLKITSAGGTSIAATPNPFIPGITDIPTFGSGPYQVFNNYKNHKGTLIGIETPRPLVPVDSARNGDLSSYGKIIIYDALGNLVRADLKLIMATTSRAYGAVWDGTNMAGRYVACGTYLWVISARMADGKPFSAKIKVGVTK